MWYSHNEQVAAFAADVIDRIAGTLDVAIVTIEPEDLIST